MASKPIKTGTIGPDAALRGGAFTVEVRAAIAAWLKTERSARADLQKRAKRDGVSVPLLAEWLRQATLRPDTLAKHLEVSEETLRQKLQSDGATFTVGEMIEQGRLEVAKALLLDTSQNLSVAEISYAAGWDDPRRFAINFAAVFGETPNEYRGVNARSGKLPSPRKKGAKSATAAHATTKGQAAMLREDSPKGGTVARKVFQG